MRHAWHFVVFIQIFTALIDLGVCEQYSVARDDSDFLRLLRNSLDSLEPLSEAVSTAHNAYVKFFAVKPHTPEQVKDAVQSQQQRDVVILRRKPKFLEKLEVSEDVPTYETIHQNKFYFTSPETLLQLGIRFDAVIIPSGGLDDTGRPSKSVTARIDGAAALNGTTRFYVSSGAYTPLKAPFLSSSGHPITEARSDAVYLAEVHKVPKSKIILEEMSKDTLGNAFFTRILCNLMTFQRLVVVTNKFHMPRTHSLFEWVFSLPMETLEFPVTLFYLETPDRGMTDSDVVERGKKEYDSLRYFWLQTRTAIKNMEELGKFIYLGHRAYAFNDTVGSYNVTVSEGALKFY